MAKPPRRSMITGVHIALKMYFVAAGALRRTWCLSSVRRTRRRTHNIGTRRDVTNRGMTCLLEGERIRECLCGPQDTDEDE